MVWKPHVTVATVVPRNGKYLFVVEDVRGDIVINQPAGHLDPSETLMEAARRETREETGYDVEITSLLGIYQWKNHRHDKEFLRISFLGEVVSHDPDAELDDGILEAVWLSRDELVSRSHQHRSPMVLQCIDDHESSQPCSLDFIRALNV